ncbi:MAG: hypothetical protein Q8O14_04750 [bacterium]|jgi:hypothetical protein|nr:hypothetical protein [bacterium]
MSMKEAYRQKMEAELEWAKAKLAEAKDESRSLAADARVTYATQIAAAEQKLEQIRSKLLDLDVAGDDAWGQVKEGLDQAWTGLSAAIRNVVASFKK